VRLNVQAIKSHHVGSCFNKYLNVKLRGARMDKAWIASELRSQIAYYTELTVNEHISGKLDKEADKTWKKVEKLINKLGGLDD
jgi:hypothetical protein